MRVFADTSYWIAIFDPKDDLHEKALKVAQRLSTAEIVTSEMVLGEFLNSFASSGRVLRERVARSVEALRRSQQVTVTSQTPEQFEDALRLYQQAKDKDWSITDCASFNIMRDIGISIAIAYDRHFEQAGYKALLR